MVETSYEFGENAEFEEVPFHVMRPADWRTAKMGMWQNRSEHISLKEGRCFVLALRRLSRDRQLRGKKTLLIVDNLSLAMAVSKGRAHDYRMLRICQQVAALSLAADMLVRARWVPSEVNPADGPSRGDLQPNSGWEAAKKNLPGAIVDEGAQEKGVDRRISGDFGGFNGGSFEPSTVCGGHMQRRSQGSSGALPHGHRLFREEEENTGGREEISPTKGGQAEGDHRRQVPAASTRPHNKGMLEEGVMSRLEMASVGKAQREQYARYLSSFKDFCLECEQEWPPVDADWMLADFFDLMYLDGHSLAVGEKVIASVEFAFIHLKGKLHRAKRALRGWRKLAPPKSRLPLPKPIAYGLAMIMLAQGKRSMALKLLLDFDLYLRPAEGMDILAEHVIKPVPGAGKQYQKYSVIIRDQELGVPDKTGIFDNTLILNNPHTERWLGPHLLALAKRVTKGHHIFNFTGDQFREQFQQAGRLLDIADLQTYQLRHGGASEDLNSRCRSYNEVKERGRWRTDTSVRRYAKTGKIQQMLSQLSAHHLEYCKKAVRVMPQVLDGRISASLP